MTTEISNKIVLNVLLCIFLLDKVKIRMLVNVQVKNILVSSMVNLNNACFY